MTQPSEHRESDFGVFSNLRYDIPAGIVVFLVAVPLCLGIALASGAPLFSGLIAGVIGGILVTLLSRSALGVSGPAAGLAVIVLAAIQEFGFDGFLLSLVLAGVFQVAMGYARAGIIGYYFPSAVITGMLSGIGIIIMLKQIPHMVGYDEDYQGDISFLQHDDYTTFSELSHMLGYVSPGAVIIGLVSLAILILWEQPFIKKYRFLQLIQGSLVAVIAGVSINAIFQHVAPQLALSGDHLVAIPVAEKAGGILDHFVLPDFSQIANPRIYLTAITIAVVASLETLLCVEATDKLDPYKRVTPTNRELIAQGVANSCSGLIGGLPVTQVIVRSSANIQSGARTKAAAFVHGVLVLLAVTVIPHVLNLIPLASLAAILLMVGYKLAKPSLFVRMYKTGLYHFVPYMATIVGLVFSDMLIGIAIGMGVALFSILLENYRMALYYHEEHENNKTVIKLSEHVSFLNKAHILRTLDHLPAHSEVVIDGTDTVFIDYDVFEIIENFKQEALGKDIKLEVINLPGYGALRPARKPLPLPGGQSYARMEDALALKNPNIHP